MSSSTKALRLRVTSMLKDAGATVVDVRGHRGHLRFLVDIDGHRLDLNTPGSPTDIDVCVEETRRKLQRKLRERADRQMTTAPTLLKGPAAAGRYLGEEKRRAAKG